jgi:hypothetical protein
LPADQATVEQFGTGINGEVTTLSTGNIGIATSAPD